MMDPENTPVIVTEADLCAAFIAAATGPSSRGRSPWTAYPETAGFDILMVREPDGVQIGIEAKLALNPHVVAQALPDREGWLYGTEAGPDFRAVLVPSEKIGAYLSRICAALGVTVIGVHTKPPPNGGQWGSAFMPRLPDDSFTTGLENWFPWAPPSRCPVPEYVPDVLAGASAPVALTLWKVKAIRISILLEERPVTRADFRHFQISPTNWLGPGGWLEKTDAGWVAGPRTPDFRAQHPRNYEQIRADKARWHPSPKDHPHA